MTDNPDDIVTLKIRRDSREWVKDHQREIQKAERREVTHAEIFERMLKAYKGTPAIDPLDERALVFSNWVSRALAQPADSVIRRLAERMLEDINSEIPPQK